MNIRKHLPLGLAVVLSAASIYASAVAIATGGPSLVGVHAAGDQADPRAATLPARSIHRVAPDANQEIGAPRLARIGGVAWKLIGLTCIGALLSGPFDAPQREGETIEYPVGATVVFYPGGLVAINAFGMAVNAQDAPNYWVCGRCEEPVDNSAGLAGAVNVTVRRGIFAYQNSVADPCGGSDVGNVVFCESDYVINKSGGANKVAAGRLLQIDPVTGALWVNVCDQAVLVP